MANQEHIDLLKQGSTLWNKWRDDNPDIRPDFSRATFTSTNLNEANLTGANFHKATLSEIDFKLARLSYADLSEADLSGADLRYANLTKADLSEVNLTGANLAGANLSRTDLTQANLSQANFSQANLSGADLFHADLSHANLNYADLSNTSLIGTNLRGATLTDCMIYGLTSWDVLLEETKQFNLIITPQDQPIIAVDNLKVAQFISLLLNNQEVREVVDTITSKIVLILGRFTSERKAVLDTIRDELRKLDYLPVFVDFERPVSRDQTETVSTLAHLARFIIVDLTDPSSAPHEVATIIPQTIVPVQPLLTLQELTVEGKSVERREFAMFKDLRQRYHWVLPTIRYQDTADLHAALKDQIIELAEQKARELAKQ